MFAQATFVARIIRWTPKEACVGENREQRGVMEVPASDRGGLAAPSSDAGFEPRALDISPVSIRRTAGTVVAEKFALQRVIASGGMGTVFEAWDTFLERKVAIKVMHPQYAADPALVARFAQDPVTGERPADEESIDLPHESAEPAR